MRRYIGSVVILLGLLSCKNDSFTPPTGPKPRTGCGPYPEQSTSEYVLPYEVGTSYIIGQGNCSSSNRSHATGSLDQHSYDFLMPIGSNISAARGGEVTHVVENFEENNGVPGEENVINIKHEDGTFGVYFHLTKDGALVNVGDQVTQGQVIALSGNTGNSSAPHLHFHVWSVPLGTTIPTVFKNTVAHPSGLREGTSYTAEDY